MCSTLREPGVGLGGSIATNGVADGVVDDTAGRVVQAMIGEGGSVLLSLSSQTVSLSGLPLNLDPRHPRASKPVSVSTARLQLVKINRLFQKSL